MIAYFNCICTSTNRLRANKLRQEGYTVIDLSKDRARKAEALSYKLKLPIIVENGMARSL